MSPCRHRRIRVLYGERWQALKDAIDRHFGGAIAIPQPQTGMHTVGWLPGQMNDQQVSRAAALEGVEARPLSLYAINKVKPGLVLGFATVPPKEINEGARKLARAFEMVLRENRTK